nr:hypothetical protein Itr_chr08CG03420 [Ipomoea trifida]
MGCGTVSVRPSRGGENTTGMYSSAWHGNLEFLKCSFSASIPFNLNATTLSYLNHTIIPQKNKLKSTPNQSKNYLNSRVSYFADLPGVEGFPGLKMKRLVQPPCCFWGSHVHKTISHVALVSAVSCNESMYHQIL